VDVSLFFEESEEDKAFKEKYSTFTGMLSVPKILEKATRANTNGSYVFFISGPPGMIESFKGELIEDGIVPDRIITDEWS
jgi:hypothetical protein